MKTSTLSYLINLLNVSKIGPKRVRTLILDNPDIESIFSLSEKELCKSEGIDQRLAQEIRSYTHFDYGQKEIERIDKLEVKIISILDDEYPLLLKNIHNPPILLYIKGKMLKPKEDTVAIVGSRITTDYGRTVTQSITKQLVSSGITVVSGLARGIDTIAHREVVKTGGRTIAVLGCGIDRVYPSENKKLFHNIMEEGTIVSEFPLGTLPEPGNFPQRNRIISGLCHATVVVEAGNKSGAILTALNAVDQNREVYAVPGRINDKQSVGCLRLIKHGAIPVESGEQIVEQIQPHLFSPKAPIQSKIQLEVTKEESKILQYISNDPIHIDSLVKKMDTELTSLLNLLLQMELKGMIKQIGGKQFVRVF